MSAAEHGRYSTGSTSLSHGNSTLVNFRETSYRRHQYLRQYDDESISFVNISEMNVTANVVRTTIVPINELLAS